MFLLKYLLMVDLYFNLHVTASQMGKFLICILTEKKFILTLNCVKLNEILKNVLKVIVVLLGFPTKYVPNPLFAYPWIFWVLVGLRNVTFREIRQVVKRDGIRILSRDN